MSSVRPTIRCLRDDLQLPLPPVNDPLDEMDHPLLTKATAQFGDPAASPERIRTVDDNVLDKVKVQRWRGAVWREAQNAWLVAAGWREAGSPDDFHATLTAEAVAARRRYNSEYAGQLRTKTYSDQLLPKAEDRERYRLEGGIRFLRRLRETVHTLLRASLRDGQEHAAEADTFDLGIQVRADRGHETYVAVRVIGSVPANLLMLIFDYVPGCDRGAWFPEAAMPDRPGRAGEQVWSNIMDPAAAAKLLDLD